MDFTVHQYVETVIFFKPSNVMMAMWKMEMDAVPIALFRYTTIVSILIQILLLYVPIYIQILD